MILPGMLYYLCSYEEPSVVKLSRVTMLFYTYIPFFSAQLYCISRNLVQNAQHDLHRVCVLIDISLQ
jgi:hypothetical protein